MNMQILIALLGLIIFMLGAIFLTDHLISNWIIKGIVISVLCYILADAATRLNGHIADAPTRNPQLELLFKYSPFKLFDLGGKSKDSKNT